MQSDLLTFRLETERLVLLPVSTERAEDIFREFTDEVTVYMTPKPAKDISETLTFIRTSEDGMRKGEELLVTILD